ncbi:MAG TPA: serine/threonine-protein kinase [Thermoanaerobaculia bacterium]|nr:serine/threonine-protein kinase [Thermoanaerobaculia bacterium]
MSPEFENYTISCVLGEGGMGLVYLAHDRRTGLPVAIKVMSRREFDPELRARFLKENRILSALNHRNIVRCYEITESTDGVLSIVMEYVDGVDFRAFEGRPYPELLPLMIQALMGLAYLRSQNVVHRDLSSNNIFVTLENQTRVTKILDFGVAKILQEQTADGDVRTRTGQFLGKFAFASPEHFFPATIDWRSDVYSLGVIFHRLLTKKQPLTVARKANYYDWLVAHQRENVFEVLAPAGVPPLPEGLRDIVRRMLSRSPDDRPQSYEEILDVLGRDQRAVPAALEPDPEALRTLPSPVEGRIGSSNPSSPPSPSPAVARSAPVAAEAEAPTSVEASQQKRWPDLAPPESPTERFAPLPSRHAPGAPPSPPPPAESSRPETLATVIPAMTENLPSPAASDSTQTAPTVVPDGSARFSEISIWSGGAAKGEKSEPDSSSSSSRPPEEKEEKTERLDDVIAKLRQQSSREPLPPLREPSTPDSFISAPPAQPVRRPEPEPVSPRASEHTPAAAPKPGRRLVVYGEPPPAAVAPPREVLRATPPAASPPVTVETPRRIRGIGIGLIVAAIVILFAAILWVLISLLRGSPGETRRSSHAGPTGVVAAAAVKFVHPKPE